MLPKNNLRRDQIRRLRVFAGPEHPHSENLFHGAAQSASTPEGAAEDLARLRSLMFNELKGAHKNARKLGVQAIAAQIGVNPVLATKPAMKMPPKEKVAATA